MPLTDEQKAEIMKNMELAARDATHEFAGIVGRNKEAAVEFANWWYKWYLKAGHKRLAYILMDMRTK